MTLSVRQRGSSAEVFHPYRGAEMALYFFHLFDGDEIREVTEAECSTLVEVRVRLLETALGFVKQPGSKRPAWSLEVRDNRGVIVSMLELVDCLSQDSPTIRLI